MLFALTMRISFLLIIPDLSFPDSIAYIKSGNQLFSNGIIHIDNVMPLFPIITHTIGSHTGIKIFNILISVFSVFILYKLVLSILNDRKVAILTALMMAFYPMIIFYSITAITETLYVFLILCSLLSLYNKKIVLGSIFIVISILLRPTLDLLAPILIFLFSYFLHHLNFKKSFLDVSKYILIYIILMSPWWMHQYHKYGQFVRLNLGDGIVLYSGNNNINKSGGGIGSSKKGKDMDLSLFSNIKDPIKKNNAMKQAAYDFIVNNPKRFVELAGLKFVRFWRLWPYAPEYEKPFYIIVSLLSYGVVLLLSILFLIKLKTNDFRRVLPMLLIAAYFTVVHMVLIGSIRYRLPIEPFLLIFSSAYLVNLITKV